MMAQMAHEARSDLQSAAPALDVPRTDTLYTHNTLVFLLLYTDNDVFLNKIGI